MKTIIFVSGIQVFPPESGGQLRSANFCRALANLGHKVEIYSFTGRKKDYLHFKKSSEEKIQENISEFVNRNPILGIIQFLFYSFNLPPLWLTALTSFFLPKKLKNMASMADSILLDFPYLYPLSSKFDIPLMINTHNAEFELYSEKKLISSLVKNIEIKGFKKADNIFFCNKEDETKFIKDYSELKQKSCILPNGVRLDDYIHNEEDRIKIRQLYKIEKEKKVFLFTGSRYLPNLLACEFLIKWSHENAQFLNESNIIIFIAGTVWEPRADYGYLKIAGRVRSMAPLFSASDFGLNPITTGSGTNVKMIEFLAAKLPILTTKFGARGLQLVDNNSCFFFDHSNLASIIAKAINLNLADRSQMATGALSENRTSVDMTHALNSLSIKW